MIDLIFLDFFEFDDMFEYDLSYVMLECFIDCFKSLLKENESVFIMFVSVCFELSFFLVVNIMLFFFMLILFIFGS